MSDKHLRLGRFTTEALLGQGPTTESYRALLSDPKGDGRKFVITVLGEQAGALDPQMPARFIEAARRLAGMEQAGCVRVVELGEGPGRIYAVHEFKVGVNLAQLRVQAAPKGGMDPRLVGVVARKLSERLAALHSRSQAPQVHGGLNPGNVLVTPDGDVLLLDCGLAEAVRPRGDEFTSRWLYAAPEHVAGGTATPASDLYSIGALIHLLYVGRPPFVATTKAALVEKVAAGVPAIAGMPPWLQALMVRLLSGNPGQRPKTAAEVARQISAAMLAAETGHVSAFVPPSLPESGGAPEMAKAPSVPAVTSATPEPASAPKREPAGETVVPFSLDDIPTEDERPRVLRERTAAKEPVVPFSLDAASPEPSDDDDDEPRERLGPISADDPDVGVVYDEDDDEHEQVEVGKDGKRRRRRRRIRIPVWVRSELARRMSRLALIPLIGLVLVALAAGVFFYREWSATRQESERHNAELTAEIQKRQQSRQMSKPPESPTMPAGQLVVKTTPAGAVVWIDGVEKERTPYTIVTNPGSHRIVVTLPGYRMLRDVVDTGKGVLWEREMFAAPSLSDGRVPVAVTCLSENKYPVFVDGKDTGGLCPVGEIKLDPGRHSIGVFVIPQNRIWAFDREIQAGRPHRVQFNY
jgi:serine/threonine-protein kinase